MIHRFHHGPTHMRRGLFSRLLLALTVTQILAQPIHLGYHHTACDRTDGLSCQDHGHQEGDSTVLLAAPAQTDGHDSETCVICQSYLISHSYLVCAPLEVVGASEIGQAVPTPPSGRACGEIRLPVSARAPPVCTL